MKMFPVKQAGGREIEGFGRIEIEGTEIRVTTEAHRQMCDIVGTRGQAIDALTALQVALILIEAAQLVQGGTRHASLAIIGKILAAGPIDELQRKAKP